MNRSGAVVVATLLIGGGTRTLAAHQGVMGESVSFRPAPVESRVSVAHSDGLADPDGARPRTRGPFSQMLTIFIGNRVGLEWNDGRGVRKIEYVRGLPYVGWAMVPIFCFETFSEKSMQQVANRERIDRRRQVKYDAHIAQLEASDQHEEAAYFQRVNPFDPAKRPPDPMARVPKKELDGFKGNPKAFWVEMIVGHRAALERIEGRGLWKRSPGKRAWMRSGCASG
jgi:hypothetical protein